MYHLQVDIEHGRTAGLLQYEVILPNSIEERFLIVHVSFSDAGF
jgi:hypothetical protein